MIIHTNRATEISEWIDANCERSSYSMNVSVDTFVRQRNVRRSIILARIDLNLHPDDQIMFDLFFHGWFIKHPVHDRYFDDTEINRMMLSLYQDV